MLSLFYCYRYDRSRLVSVFRFQLFSTFFGFFAVSISFTFTDSLVASDTVAGCCNYYARSFRSRSSIQVGMIDRDLSMIDVEMTVTESSDFKLTSN